MSRPVPSKAEGFTLVEILVVASITVFITGILVANFSRSRVDLNQTVLTVTDAIREAQALTLAGSVVKGTARCGFGIHFTPSGYIVYAGPDAATNDCAAQDRNYNAGTDDIVRQALLSNNVLEIAPPFVDIFFEPPDPVTYIGGSSSPAAAADIVVRRKGAQCTQKTSADCRTIHVSGTGIVGQ